jgi:hypothetical protein
LFVLYAVLETSKLQELDHADVARKVVAPLDRVTSSSHDEVQTPDDARRSLTSIGHV